MVVYACPKCRTQLASPPSMVGQYETCPSCSSQVRIVLTTAGPALEPTQLIEKTSKGIKAQKLAAALTILFAAFLFALLAGLGVRGWILPLVPCAIGLLGICWLAAAEFLGWWRHG